MDDPAFDRVTRLFWAPGSRRAALGPAVLGAALVGSARQTAAAAPRHPRQGRGPRDLRRGPVCAAATGCDARWLLLLGPALQLRRRVLQQPVLLVRTEPRVLRGAGADHRDPVVTDRT